MTRPQDSTPIDEMLDNLIRDTHAKARDGDPVLVVLHGIALVLADTRRILGRPVAMYAEDPYRTKPERPRGDKHERALPLAAAWGGGRVKLPSFNSTTEETRRTLADDTARADRARRFAGRRLVSGLRPEDSTLGSFAPGAGHPGVPDLPPLGPRIDPPRPSVQDRIAGTSGAGAAMGVDTARGRAAVLGSSALAAAQLEREELDQQLTDLEALHEEIARLKERIATSQADEERRAGAVKREIMAALGEPDGARLTWPEVYEAIRAQRAAAEAHGAARRVSAMWRDRSHQLGHTVVDQAIQITELRGDERAEGNALEPDVTDLQLRYTVLRRAVAEGLGITKMFDISPPTDEGLAKLVGAAVRDLKRERQEGAGFRSALWDVLGNGPTPSDAGFVSKARELAMVLGEAQRQIDGVWEHLMTSPDGRPAFPHKRTDDGKALPDALAQALAWYRQALESARGTVTALSTERTRVMHSVERVLNVKIPDIDKLVPVVSAAIEAVTEPQTKMLEALRTALPIPVATLDDVVPNVCKLVDEWRRRADELRAEIKVIGAAHERGVVRWRESDPNRGPSLPPTREELVLWLLGQLDDATEALRVADADRIPLAQDLQIARDDLAGRSAALERMLPMLGAVRGLALRTGGTADVVEAFERWRDGELKEERPTTMYLDAPAKLERALDIIAQLEDWRNAPRAVMDQYDRVLVEAFDEWFKPEEQAGPSIVEQLREERERWARIQPLIQALHSWEVSAGTHPDITLRDVFEAWQRAEAAALDGEYVKPRGPLTLDEAIEIARRAAAGPNRPSYYAEPFDPHPWVIDAMILLDRALRTPIITEQLTEPPGQPDDPGVGPDDDDSGFALAAANEGARTAAECRADAEADDATSDPGSLERPLDG